MANFTFGWVDLAVLILLGVGVYRGRRRGMSEELLDVIRWALIVLVGANIYYPLGSFMADMTPFSRLSCYVTVYVTTIIIFKIVFSFIRRSVGEKLLGSDFFGVTEYYLGMVAGAFRYFCMIVAAFALLNARYYTPEEIRADDTYQERNYGSKFFPTMYGFQRQVFECAMTGQLARNYGSFLLIRPTHPEEKGLTHSNIARAREHQFNELMDKR